MRRAPRSRNRRDPARPAAQPLMAVPKPPQIQAALVEWLDERYAFSESINRELYRRVPNYTAAFHYYLGAMVVILIVLEFITGFLLGLYYVPVGTGNPSSAYAS